MPFIGSQPAVGFAAIAKDDLTADGSTTAFTLSRVVGSANDIAVFVGNVRQEPTDAYTISGTTLTMSAAPASGLNFYVLHLGGGIQSSTVPAAGTTVPGDFGVSGDFTVDTDTLFVDASTNNVGIGTNSPTNNLHVYEDGTDTNSVLIIEADGTGNCDADLHLKSDDSNSGRIRFFDDTGEGARIEYAHPTGVLTVDVEGSEVVRIGSSGLSFDGGSNHLDDYEEGTWTVTFHDALTGGNTSNTTVTGYYTKIGRQVTASFNAGNIDSTGMTGSSNFFWSAPFTAGPYADQTMGSVRLYANVADSTASLASQIADNNSRGVITESRDATTLDNPVWNDFVDDASDVTVTITYFV